MASTFFFTDGKNHVMQIEFTAHALKRMEERDIGRNEIALVLTDPEEKMTVKFGRRAAFRYFNETGLVVISAAPQ